MSRPRCGSRQHSLRSSLLLRETAVPSKDSPFGLGTLRFRVYAGQTHIIYTGYTKLHVPFTRLVD